jgi:hypothetical protein
LGTELPILTLILLWWKACWGGSNRLGPGGSPFPSCSCNRHSSLHSQMLRRYHVSATALFLCLETCPCLVHKNDNILFQIQDLEPGNQTASQCNLLHGLSPQANYTNRAATACQRG